MEYEKNIKGLEIYPELITPTEESEIVSSLEKEEWSREISRETLHFGYQYFYKTRTISPAKPVPEYLQKIVDKIQPFFSEEINQVIVNAYKAGQGIAPHTDHTVYFGKEICSLSLNCTTDIIFEKNKEVINISAKRRHLLIMKDGARYEWKHSLKMPKNEQEIRYSITCRHVKKKFQ